MREPDAPEQRASPAEKPFRCIKRRRRGTRQRAIRRARRSARGFRGRTRRAVLSPVAQPPGEVYGRGRKGAHTSALDVERAEIPGNAASCFFPYAEQLPRCSLRGFLSQEGRIRGDQPARRAVFSHMRDSRRAELPDGAYRLMEGKFRGSRQRAIRRRRLHRRSHFGQLRPTTMWSERR